MENNKAIASLFRQIAALLDEQEVAFKPAAYRRGAQVLEDLDRDIATFEGEKSLMDIPGIGKAMAGKILEYLNTGEIAFLQKLRLEQGGLSPELMEIEGLGPKRVRLLQSELGITTIDQLIAAAKDGKLRDLDRFSELMESKILEWALRRDERVKRFDRSDVLPDVEMLLGAISVIEGVERCSVAGSYRRGKPTVGDIDVLVVTADPQKVSEGIVILRRSFDTSSKLSASLLRMTSDDNQEHQEDQLVRNVVAHGDTKLSFDLHKGLRVDVRFVKREEWGSALLYFTGSKEHNIAMRKVAISKGWKLNEYGLFDGDRIIAQQEEEDIYAALGLRFYEPQERMGGL